MHRLCKALIVPVLCAVTGAVVGCQTSSGTWATRGYSRSGFYRTGDSMKEHAVDMEQLTRNGKAYLLVCAANYSESKVLSGPSASGELKTRDNRHMLWTCETRDGSSGTFGIEGQKFDIAQGHLFLIETSGGKTQVKQVNADISAETLDIHTFAAKTPEVKTFFAASGNAP